jgi:hypothetical protein
VNYNRVNLNTTPSSSVEELEGKLNSFKLSERSQALAELLSQVRKGILTTQPERDVANMHCHTFYSFNAYGYSPSGLVWMAKKRGFPLLGIVDFDVLDGVDEFLDASFSSGVRASAALETRVFLPEFATREINSPGEPGVYYYMGIGFTTSQAPEEAAAVLADMCERATQRNRVMIDRINAYLSPVCLDYERDVLPLTPAGNATERHILEAYTRAAAAQWTDPTSFWAEKLKLTVEQTTEQMQNMPGFQNTIRARLMKRGGVGYAQPGPGSFPSVEEVNGMIEACQALPCATWLDGTLPGEQAMEELLELLISKGVVALNIVPDRNWNIADPDTRQMKVNKLYEVVALAQKLDLPLNIGTEMNTYGQKLVDDFHQPELAPVRQAFLQGAYFIYGHTIMQRTLGLGYQSAWAKSHLPIRRARNDFYTRIGLQTPATPEGITRLKRMSPNADPAEFLG